MQQNIQGYLIYFLATLALSAMYAVVFAAFKFGQHRAIFFASLLIVILAIVVLHFMMRNPNPQGPWSSIDQFVILTGLVSVICLAVVVTAGLRSFVLIKNQTRLSFSEWREWLGYVYRLSPLLVLIWNLINIILLIILSLPRKM